MDLRFCSYRKVLFRLHKLRSLSAKDFTALHKHAAEDGGGSVEAEADVRPC